MLRILIFAYRPQQYRMVVIALAILVIGLTGQSLSAPQTQPTSFKEGLSVQRFRRAIDDPLGRQKAQVYELYDEYAIRGIRVNIKSVQYMIDVAVKKLSGQTDIKKAWHYFIHDNDVVAIKFTRFAGGELGVNRPVAAALLQSLYSAGFKPDNFMLVGLDDIPPQGKGTRPWHYGWQKATTSFGSASDHLATWLNDVTAIINVPSIMDDNIIGLRCALANLAWPVIKSPAKLYIAAGDPFIPEIYNLPQIQGKVRLNIAIGLRVLYYGGPVVNPAFIKECGTIFASLDPVALDEVILIRIQQLRRERPLPKSAQVNITAPYLKTAYALGLGYDDLNFIDYHYIRLYK